MSAGSSRRAQPRVPDGKQGGRGMVSVWGSSSSLGHLLGRRGPGVFAGKGQQQHAAQGD